MTLKSRPDQLLIYFSKHAHNRVPNFMKFIFRLERLQTAPSPPIAPYRTSDMASSMRRACDTFEKGDCRQKRSVLVTLLGGIGFAAR